MPAISSPSTAFTPLLLPLGWPSEGTAQMRELSQIAALSMNSPSSSKYGNTSRSIFGPVVGRSLTEPRYLLVCGSTEIRYNGFISSNTSRSRPFLTATLHLSRSENISALLQNIASISIGNLDAFQPSINFSIVAFPSARVNVLSSRIVLGDFGFFESPR